PCSLGIRAMEADLGMKPTFKKRQLFRIDQTIRSSRLYEKYESKIAATRSQFAPGGGCRKSFARPNIFRSGRQNDVDIGLRVQPLFDLDDVIEVQSLGAKTRSHPLLNRKVLTERKSGNRDQR